MRRLFAAAAATVLLLTPATAMAAPAPTSTPSGNVQFKVTLPPSKPAPPTAPGHSAGNRGVNAGTGTPTGELLVLAGGLLFIGCLVLLGSRLLPVRPGSNTQARPHR